ncbi:MAG: MFS transporter [Legionellales bacterium]|nr:MFS transporter [Legionellales bacterium]
MSLFALCLGLFMVMVDVMIVSVALPNIAQDLSANISGLQWVVDGYTLTATAFLLSAGTVGDRLGAKTAFIVGLFLFVLTSIGCGLASSIFILTVFRLLQGMAAAFIIPTSIALLNASYDDKKKRANAIGVWAMVSGVGAASSPLLGGVITAFFGWRGVFFVNVPFGILAIILTIKYVVSPSRKPIEGFDLAGQVTAIISLTALAFGLIEAGRLGWTSNTVLLAFSLFGISTTVFLLIEYFSKYPIVPLSFFKSHIFSSTVLVGMMSNIGFYGILFILPLYFQELRGYSILMSGVVLTPLLLCNPVASYFSGRVAGIVGTKLPMIIGLSVSTIGFLSLLAVGKSTPQYVWLILPLIAIGTGTAFCMPAATITILHAVPTERGGIGSGLFNASRQLGSLLGVAVFGTIITTSTTFISGMHTSLILAACAYFVGVLLVFFARG